MKLKLPPIYFGTKKKNILFSIYFVPIITDSCGRVSKLYSSVGELSIQDLSCCTAHFGCKKNIKN